MSTTKSSRVLRAAAAGAVCLALAFGTAGVALAGSRSHDRGHSSAPRDNGQQSTHVSGVVSALGTNSITLKGRHGTTTTYTTVPGTTTYFEGKTAGVATDLVVGDRVNLDLTTTSPQTVTQVTICLVRWTGTVTGVSGNVISITAFHNTSLSVDVTTGVTTYTLGGAASTLGAIKTGALISATQSINTDGGKHGSFDALVWAPNSFTGTLDLIVADASSAAEQAMSCASALNGQGEHELASGACVVAAARNSFAYLPVLIFFALDMR